MDKMKQEASRQIEVQEQELSRRQSFPILRQRVGTVMAGTDDVGSGVAQERSARSEPIHPVPLQLVSAQKKTRNKFICFMPNTHTKDFQLACDF